MLSDTGPELYRSMMSTAQRMACRQILRLLRLSCPCAPNDFEGLKDARDKVADILDAYPDLKTYKPLISRVKRLQQRVRTAADLNPGILRRERVGVRVVVSV